MYFAYGESPFQCLLFLSPFFDILNKYEETEKNRVSAFLFFCTLFSFQSNLMMVEVWFDKLTQTKIKVYILENERFKQDVVLFIVLICVDRLQFCIVQ